MSENFDITSVPKDGYLIFALSMSRLANAQSGKAIYDFVKFFESKIRYISIDAIVLYTNDLYLNSDDKAVDVRKKSLGQMLNHKGELLKPILRDKKYVPQAFHFLPWDYVILNADNFQESQRLLAEAFKNNNDFHDIVLADLKNQGRETSDTNISFILEEIVVTYLMLEKQISLPNTLTNPDSWRMICYPGIPIESLKFACREKLLPQNKDRAEDKLKFRHSFYNMEEKVIIDLDK
jgi:hypothetical protein